MTLLKSSNTHPLVSKMVNYITKDGKKSIAMKILARSFSYLSNGPDDLLAAIHTLKPAYEVKSKRVGGSTYIIPAATSVKRSEFLAMHWLIEGSVRRASRTSFAAALAAEIQDVLGGVTCYSLKSRENLLKQAASNQTFAHIRV